MSKFTRWFLGLFFEKGLVDIYCRPRYLLERLLAMKSTEYGTLVGEDQYGNRYYENLNQVKHRSRFVEFPYRGPQEWDGTLVPPEWYNWLHNTTGINNIIRSNSEYRRQKTILYFAIHT